MEGGSPTQLSRVLSFKDLLLFGVASIMGSGGFNLIGNAIITGGPWFAGVLAAVSALFQGVSHSYEVAYKAFRTNTSESDLVKQEFGEVASSISSITILAFNILSISTILVISSKLLFPKGTWSGQIGFALCILFLMSGFSLQGIDVNKTVISFFGASVLVLALFASTIGLVEAGVYGIPTKAPTALHANPPNLVKSALYFFFVLAGFDTIIKLSEEAKEPDSNIPRSFYMSNAISTLLVIGISFAFLLVFSTHHFQENENVIARIVGSMLGPGAGAAAGFLSIVLMISTGFICFLATSRYIYGLGKKIPEVAWLSSLNEKKVPWKSVILTTVVAAIGIVVNNVYTLVKISDIGLTLTMLFVTAAAWKRGSAPLIEAATTLGLLAVLSFCCLPS
jgi:amino acid transporter